MAYISFQPSDYFNTKLYTGTGATNAQTSVGFQPDWVWIQNRGGTYANVAFDAVRGATKLIEPAGDGMENTVSDTLTSFDSDGFTLGADSSNYCNRSSSPNTYVAWNWKANGAGSANTDGSINSTATSASTTSGFSIVKYTGTGSNATVGHGLGVAPEVVWIKKLSGGGNEGIYAYMKSIGASNTLTVQSDAASASASSLFNDTDPTSSVFSIGTHASTNASGSTYIAYCFAPINGFSKFGKYYGNNSTWGTFVNCGFKPGMVIVKCDSNASTPWVLLDNKRSSSGGPNPNDRWLYANVTDAEVDQSSNPTDFLSNGFKLRNNGGYMNGSGRTYTFMAFAAKPLVSSNNVPVTAR